MNKLDIKQSFYLQVYLFYFWLSLLYWSLVSTLLQNHHSYLKKAQTYRCWWIWRPVWVL